mmetsp:Transcript_64909/g.205051  ORF Transcript_64909/g.205051 Transcript_64909/m.205051 type:complete len:91 (+) Transcript_64909:57-329(+)
MAPKGKDVAKATKAAKAVKAGALKKGAMKRRTSVTFHRPKTLIRAREPAYPRQSAPSKERLDAFSVRTGPSPRDIGSAQCRRHLAEHEGV